MASSSSSDSCGSDTDSESSRSSRSSTRSFNDKKLAIKRLRDRNYFFDKFGRCEECQEIYWEMRHTWNDDDGGGRYSYEWYSDERYLQYEHEGGDIDLVPYKEIMRQYRNKLRGCPDCPLNKDTPCSLRDLAYSRISVIIGSTLKPEMDDDEYNRRVAKLPILDGMKKDLEAKPCTWECSHQRYMCSTLMTFD